MTSVSVKLQNGRQSDRFFRRTAGNDRLSRGSGATVDLVGHTGLKGFRRSLLAGFGHQGESKMRMWLLLMLLVSLAGALYLGFGSPGFGEKTAALVSELEDM